MTQSHPPVRWGIMGTATIARKNWLGILNSGTGVVTAVASRDRNRASRFVTDCQKEAPFSQTPEAVESYPALLARDDVDAVYIPLPTGLRKEWVLRAAAAGKHVLCEKPCAPTVAELEEMIGACRQHRVQFMDGVMFMHSLRLPRLRSVIDDATTVGHVKRITSQFSFLAPDDFFTDNIRAHGDLEPLGCLGDLGWYCIRLSLWVMNCQMPRRVTGRLLAQAARPDSDKQVPTEFSGELLFSDGVSAGFYCSFLTEHQEWANISGTRGYVSVPDFVLPFDGDTSRFETQNSAYVLRGCRFAMESHVRAHTVAEPSHGHGDAQESRMFQAFHEGLTNGRGNGVWAEWALQTQRVINACLESARRDGQPVDLESPAN